MTASSENSCYHFSSPSDWSSSSRISIYYNQNNSFNLDLFSATHTLSSSILTLNSQCVGVAKEVKIKRVILIAVRLLRVTTPCKCLNQFLKGYFQGMMRIRVCLIIIIYYKEHSAQKTGLVLPNFDISDLHCRVFWYPSWEPLVFCHPKIFHCGR